MSDYRVHRVRFFEYNPQAIQCMSYQPSNQTLALSRSDGSLELWNVGHKWYQEEVIRGREGHSIEAIVWQNKRLFTAGLDGFISEIDLKKYQTKRQCPSNSGPVWSMTTNSSCTRLAAGTEDGGVVLLKTEDDSLEYIRGFDKLEGRILCLAWHENEDVLVSGGIDNIRLWNPKTGQAVQRLTLGRQHLNQETVVWCVAILKDYTVVSGDSRGKTSFWNGKHGTLIRTFQSHKADVYCLSVNSKETSVVVSGVDPTLVKFDFLSTREGSDWKRWVGTSLHKQHTHDVRAIQIVDDTVVSGGVDNILILTALKTKDHINTWRRVAPVPHKPLVQCAKQAGVLLLQYPDSLEVWRLGHTDKTGEGIKSGETLTLRSNPLKLIQFTTKNREPVCCSAISQDASFMAYSDQDSLRVYRIHLENLDSIQPSVRMKKISSNSDKSLESSRCLSFTNDAQKLVSVTTDSAVQVFAVSNDSVRLQHTFSAMSGVIHLLNVSPCDNFIATATHQGNISIHSLESKKCICQLPRLKYQASAFTFSPDSQSLAVVYVDQQIKEFNIEEQEYTDWCKDKCRNLPSFWLRRGSKVSRIFYHPDNHEQLVFNDEQMFCILDKTQKFPARDTDWATALKQDKDEPHAFHICNRYKYLLHLDILSDNWIVAVERSPYTLLSQLPDTLNIKKFGT